MRSFLVHGFNVFDKGTSTTGMLSYPLNAGGVDVVNYSYGWRGLLGARFLNKKEGRELSRMINPGDVGIGHSNGCAVLMHAAENGACFEKLIFLSPALRRGIEFPDNIEEIHIFSTSDDLPTKISRFARSIPIIGLIVPKKWGDMGAKGYTGSDSRVINHYYRGMGHSGWFDSCCINSLSDDIINILNSKKR